MAERQAKWKAIPDGNAFIKGYLGNPDLQMKVAFVRILTRYNNPVSFSQYFQISYTLIDGKKDFKSFKIYDDYEEKMIKESIEGIPEHIIVS